MIIFSWGVCVPGDSDCLEIGLFGFLHLSVQKCLLKISLSFFLIVTLNVKLVITIKYVLQTFLSKIYLKVFQSYKNGEKVIDRNK